MKTIKRDLYLDQLINKMSNGLIKIITGIRRSGKSYLLFNIFKNYLLENGVKEDRNPDNLSSYLYSKISNKAEKYYILLDEVEFVISDKEVKGKEPIRL